MNDLDTLVAERMRAAVADVTAGDLLTRVRAGRRRQAYRRFGLATAGVAAVAALAMVVVSVGSVPQPPAGSPRPALESVSHGRFDLTYVPSGLAATHGEIHHHDPGAALEFLHVKNADGVTGLTLTTIVSDMVIDLDTIPSHGRSVSEVRAGERRVIRLHDPEQLPLGNSFQWTEEPGLNVVVLAERISDEEALRFVAGLRLRPAGPAYRELYTGAVVNPVTVPWTYGDLVKHDLLDVTYFATDGECRVLSDVQVVEGDPFLVTLVEATPADQAGADCPARGVTQRVRVPLGASAAVYGIRDGTAPAEERAVDNTVNVAQSPPPAGNPGR